MNTPEKDHLKKRFHKWYAEKVTDQSNAGKTPDEFLVDMKLTVMKEFGAQWLNNFQSHPEIWKNVFVKEGIAKAIANPENIYSFILLHLQMM